MLLCTDARRADGGCQAVDKQRGQRAGVFVCDYAGDGPCSRCVLRWKRDAALTEPTAIIVLQGTLTAECVLHRIDRTEAVDCGFSRQDSGFNLVIVMRDVAPQV